MDKFITRKVVSTPQPKKSSNPDSSPPTKRKRGDGDASTDSDKSNVVDITVPSEPSCSSKGLETQQKTAKKDERGFSPHWFFNMKTGEKRHWLVYKNGEMYCNVCRLYSTKKIEMMTAFYVGIKSNFKLDSITTHEKSKTHKTREHASKS